MVFDTCDKSADLPAISFNYSVDVCVLGGLRCPVRLLRASLCGCGVKSSCRRLVFNLAATIDGVLTHQTQKANLKSAV